MDLYERLAQPLTPPETALSATETPEQPTPGLCTCPRSNRLPDDCACVWGELIAALRQAAYQVAPDQALIALPHVQMRLNVELAELRKAALRRRAARWSGTINAFMRRFELTRSTYDRLGLKVPRG